MNIDRSNMLAQVCQEAMMLLQDEHGNNKEMFNVAGHSTHVVLAVCGHMTSHQRQTSPPT